MGRPTDRWSTRCVGGQPRGPGFAFGNRDVERSRWNFLSEGDRHFAVGCCCVGAAAWLAQEWPSATPTQIKKFLVASAVKVAGDMKARGAGIIQLDRAIATALPETSTTPTSYAKVVQLSEELRSWDIDGALARYIEKATTDSRYVTPYANSAKVSDATSISAATPWSGLRWSGMRWSGRTWSSSIRG